MTVAELIAALAIVPPNALVVDAEWHRLAMIDFARVAKDDTITHVVLYSKG